MPTAVLALGGNALARSGEPATVTNQFRHARESVAPIVELATQGWRIVIVHGNGPQVGDELVRNEAARKLAEPLAAGRARGGNCRLDRLHAAAVAPECAGGCPGSARSCHRDHPDAGRSLRSGAQPAHQADRACGISPRKRSGCARRVER